MRFIHDDGGRMAAGYVGKAGDCVARAVAIASGRPYAEVYARLAQGMGTQRAGKRGKSKASARSGITVGRKWFKEYMYELGFVWTPTMGIGTGCRVHLVDGELPDVGRYVVSVSKHYTAVVDGVIHDTHDPRREPISTFSCELVMGADGQLGNRIISTSGGRCVYGYWGLLHA